MAVFFLFFLFSVSLSVHAQSTQGMSEPEQLGISAGLAQACNSDKLEDFEVIASRIIANKALSDKEELMDNRTYVAAKINTLQRHKKNPQMNCREILALFNKLPIFQSIVYADGSVKMPDGTWLKPRKQKSKKKK